METPITQDRRMQPAMMMRPEPIDFARYFRVIWRRKIWIFMITVIITVLWYFFYSIFLDKPKYTAQTVIRFADPALNNGMAAVADFGVIDNQGKIAVLTTNSFIGQVVDSLNYCILVKNADINPAKLIKRFDPQNSTAYGQYKLVNKGNFVSIYFNGSDSQQDERFMQNLSLAQEEISFSGNGIIIVFNSKIVAGKNEIKINYIPRQIAINELNSKIKIIPNRSQTILTLSYEDKNPEYSAIVINKVATLFTDQLLQFKKIQTTSVIKYLQDQLIVAKTELTNAESELQKFRELNPFVFLASDRQQMVAQVADLEGNISVDKKNQQQLKQLLQRTKQSADLETRSYAYQEMLSFLQNANVPGAMVYAQQYSQLIAQHQRYLNENYTAQHPLLINNENQIQDLENQIYNFASNYNTQVENNLTKSQQASRSFYSNLRSLPRNELKLAELERNRQIKEKILSNIVSRMDEAKVADAAIIPDAYIIDTAVPPLVSESFKLKVIKYVLGAGLGLMLSIILFITIDVMNKSVRSGKELGKALNLPIVGVIPVIGSLNELPGDRPDSKVIKGKIDPKLITTNYSPDQENESFRRLRTKLSQNQDSKVKLLITSLNPNEGKSLLSSNLAIAFAQQKQSTLLVDGDLRRGVLHNSFGIEKKPGLADILMQNNPINENHISQVIQQTHIPNLNLLTNGSTVPNPSELLSGKNMIELFTYLNHMYDVIIIDTPPFRLVPDAFVLEKIIPKKLLITKYGETKLPELKESMAEFAANKNNYIGVVINASPESRLKDNYSYTYYRY